MIETIIIPMVCSLVTAILYGLFISNNEEAIRLYLKTRAGGFLRRRYVKALVGAIRGEDKVTESAQLSFVWVVVVLFLAYSSHSFIDKMVTDHNENVEYIDKILANDPFENMTSEELASEILRINSNIKNLDEEIGYFENLLPVIYWFALAYYFFFFSILRPYLLLRKRFAHEFSRYNANIQGLASKKELAELSVLESKVRDEKSLKKLIEKTIEVAERHDVTELTDSFNLWKIA